jgi:hypothetical protein
MINVKMQHAFKIFWGEHCSCCYKQSNQLLVTVAIVSQLNYAYLLPAWHSGKTLAKSDGIRIPWSFHLGFKSCCGKWGPFPHIRPCENQCPVLCHSRCWHVQEPSLLKAISAISIGFNFQFYHQWWWQPPDSWKIA